MPQTSVLEADRESRRLAAVRRYEILDTPPDGAFDRITAITAKLLSVPISIISLVDHDRIWFKSRHGLEVEEIARDPGLCASAILQNEPWILPDARANPVALTNPLVAGEFGLRFYVGVPLRTSDGYNLGTLCAIDREPRPVSEREIDYLKDLAAVVMNEMELRLAARRAISDLSEAVTEKEAALRRAQLMGKEIDHRVMNSLQLVSSMLSLQSHRLGRSEAGKQLMMAAGRVSAVARVHQHIYMSERVESTDCAAYLKRLCDDLSGVLELPPGDGIIVQGIEAEIPTGQIASIGLIVNELVMNAVKHGANKLMVSFDHAVPYGYTLSVSDDGPGLPADFDPDAGQGLGMKVVASLVQQLGGKLICSSGDILSGATFRVIFGAAPSSLGPGLH